MKFLVFGLLLYAALAGVLRGQQEEALWMPEGYRLLSVEERQSLRAEVLKEILTRNTTLLREAVHVMTPEERQAIAQSLDTFGRSHELTQIERQYVSMASMMLLAANVEEHSKKEVAAEQARFEKLLRDQEEPRPFPPDQKSVEKEAHAISALQGKEDLQRLYLRSLGALRARPWNNFIRVCFERIVGGNSISVRPVSLYDAALVFLRKREVENPNEGSWYSLEAYLRLTKRGEVAEAKKLFATANAKGAKDAECRIFPLLLAEMDGDAAEAERQRRRALEAWPKSEELDRVLLASIYELPTELNEKARATYGKKYARAHPADWASRVERLRSSIWDAERKKLYGDASSLPSAFQAVEGETTMLLSLPLSALPEPHRVELLALELRAKAGLGKCDEVSPSIGALEAEAETAYPRQFESGSQPRPSTVQDVKELRTRIEEERRGVEEMMRLLSGGSLEGVAELRDLPKDEKEEWTKRVGESLAEAEREIAEADSLLREANDSGAAAEWTRRELAGWEKSHGIPPSQFQPTYDLWGRGEGLQIAVRSALGQCLLAKARALEASRVLKPCVGGGRNFHTDCVRPLVEAGVTLAKESHVQEAVEIFRLVEPSSASTDPLFEAIEAKAPGTVKKKTPVPVSPMPRLDGN